MSYIAVLQLRDVALKYLPKLTEMLEEKYQGIGYVDYCLLVRKFCNNIIENPHTSAVEYSAAYLLFWAIGLLDVPDDIADLDFLGYKSKKEYMDAAKSHVIKAANDLSRITGEALPAGLVAMTPSRPKELPAYLDKTHPMHSDELRIAIECWEAVLKCNPTRPKQGSRKGLIDDWLSTNHPKLSNNARDRIAVLVNPDKTGVSKTS